MIGGEARGWDGHSNVEISEILDITEIDLTASQPRRSHLAQLTITDDKSH